MPNYNDPNDLTNPRSANYKPRYVFEFHVWQGDGKTNNTPVSGYIQASASVNLIKTEFPPAVLPDWVTIASLSLTFEGTLQTKIKFTRAEYNKHKNSIQNQLQQDLVDWLNQFSFHTQIDQGCQSAHKSNFSRRKAHRSRA